MKIVEVPFGFIKDGKIFKKSWGDHSDRQIGEVREDNQEKSVAFFNQRFEDLQKKISEVTEKIDATENKGSFLMKIVHLKDHLAEHEGLGDYQAAFEKLEKYESLLRDIIQKNRIRNTEIKGALLEEGKQLVEIVNWKEATEKINDLKSRWIKTGNAEEEKHDELEEQFWQLIESFFDRKKKFYEDKQKLLEHRRKQYAELVEEGKELADLHGKDRFNKVKELKESWKEIGGIPSEFYGPLYREFQQALKGKKFVKLIDYSDTLAKLDSIRKGKTPYQKDELDKIKKSLYRDKARNADKNKCLELIQLLNEYQFVLKLAEKRFSDFIDKSDEKKNEIKLKVLQDLIARDKEDLTTYEENAANFAGPEGEVNPLVAGKIKSQRKKITTKELLIDRIKSGDF